MTRKNRKQTAEQKALINYRDAHSSEGYRHLTFMVLIDDIEAVSPSTPLSSSQSGRSIGSNKVLQSTMRTSQRIDHECLDVASPIE